MRRSHHVITSRVVILAGFALAFASPVQAERRSRPAAATKADIERLEKKIEEQQQLIDKLMKLQQQYLQALTALFGGANAPEPKAAELKVEPPKPVEAKPIAEVKPSAEPRPARVEPRPRARKHDGIGTIVGRVAGASDAVVYVEDIVATTRGTATMKQEGKQFVPSVLVVQKGTTVQFPNMDAVFHNVFSVSPDNSFDLGSYRQGQSKGMTMSRPGVVSVYCNMHPQMVGHILVVPNGDFVRAGKDGFFRLPNVPAGRHRVVAWAPNAKPAVVAAQVSDTEVVTVELQLKKGRSGPHLKKDGLPYGSYED